MKKALSVLLSLCMILAVLAGGPFAYADGEEAFLITKDNPAVVIRAAYATGTFLGGPGGVMEASPMKDTDCFILYDVIVWNDRINLYKFPNDLARNETEGLKDFGKDDELYYEWRESFCLASYQYSSGARPVDRSEYLRKAFTGIFRTVYELTPSENMIYFYSGHGTLGLAEMTVNDTIKTLDSAVEAFGHPFALIDLSTNCSMSNTRTIELYHKYAKYLMASQLDVGGFTLDNWNIDDFYRCNYDEQYFSFFREGESILSACKAGMDLMPEYWKLCRRNLTDSGIRQSVTLIDLEQYDSFFRMFNPIYKEHLIGKGMDIYRALLEYGSETDQSMYQALVPYYMDNNGPDVFEWDEHLYGITADLMVQLDG